MNKVVKMLLFLAAFALISYLLAQALGERSLDFSSKVLVIPVKGMITANGVSGFVSGTSAWSLLERLEEAEKDNAVKAVILEIDSNGGTVVSSKSVADKVKEMEKPVVAIIGEHATSGAYWVASAADHIVADELSIVGSVGVIGSYLQASDLMADYGVEYERIVAGDLKDLGSPFKEPTEKEVRHLQKKVDLIHAFFLKSIQENRNLTEEEIGKVEDGSIFLGEEGLKLHLVDSLGNMDDAFARSKELANVTDADLVRSKDGSPWFSFLRGFGTEFGYSLGKGIGCELKVQSEEGIRI